MHTNRFVTSTVESENQSEREVRLSPDIIELYSAADVPNSYRIQDIVTKYRGLRSARMEFRTAEQCEREERGFVREISW